MKFVKAPKPSVPYVDTDITYRQAHLLQPSFSERQNGTGLIAGEPGLVFLPATF